MSATCTASISCPIRRPTRRRPRPCAMPPARRSPARSRRGPSASPRPPTPRSSSRTTARSAGWATRSRKLEPGDKLFEPRLRILADEQLDRLRPATRSRRRLRAWLKAHIVRLLGPAAAARGPSPELTGLARGIAFQIAEALGVLERAKVLNEVRSLDQDGRGALRKLGVRFGAYHLYLPALLKPAPRTLAAQLWALQNGGLDQKGIDEIAHLAESGRTSIPVDPEIAHGLYRAAGFRVCGGRAVRVDILERLADLIRPAIAYRPGITPGEPPAGAADGDGFVADRRHDLPRRLLRRGFRLDPEIARLRRRTAGPARPSRCRWCRAPRPIEQPAPLRPRGRSRRRPLRREAARPRRSGDGRRGRGRRRRGRAVRGSRGVRADEAAGGRAPTRRCRRGRRPRRRRPDVPPRAPSAEADARGRSSRARPPAEPVLIEVWRQAVAITRAAQARHGPRPARRRASTSRGERRGQSARPTVRGDAPPGRAAGQGERPAAPATAARTAAPERRRERQRRGRAGRRAGPPRGPRPAATIGAARVRDKRLENRRRRTPPRAAREAARSEFALRQAAGPQGAARGQQEVRL